MALDALNTATAGLRLTQAQIGVVSQNVANVGTAGYVKRNLTPVSIGVDNAGVASGTIERSIDAAALKQLRSETSGAAYTSLLANTRSQLDKLYGTPGSATALDGVFNSFTASLQTLATDPASTAARATVVSSARNVATSLNTASTGVQALRSAMEAQIQSDTGTASSLLTQIARLNTRIAGTPATDTGLPDLQDQRDQAINSLSGLMDVTTVAQGDGTTTVLTGSGVTLVEGATAARLSFDGRGALFPNALYSTDPAKRRVGTITATTPGGATIDLIANGAIRSGSIAAAVELRDTVLPQAQRQLDDLAGGLARAVSDNAATGTAATDGTHTGFDIDLTGLSAGNALTLAVKDASGVQRNLVLVPSYASPPPAIGAGETDDANATVIPFTIPKPAKPADTAGVRAALAAALGSSYTVSVAPTGPAGAVRILATGASAPTLVAASASVTQALSPSDTKNGSAQLALFVDGGSGGLYTGSFDGGSQLTGFAQRISVNGAVAANTSTLVATSATTASGDATRPEALYAALTGTARTFSSSSGIGGVSAPTSSTVSGFVQGIIASQGAASASAQSLDEGQGIALSTAQSRFASRAGVNIDDEMSKLIALQQSYTANARVLTAARDMLDTLLRI